MKRRLPASFLLALLASLSLAAHAQTFSVIHTFATQDGLIWPNAGMTLRGGLLFGTAYGGGSAGNGGVYQMKYNGSTWVFTPISDLSAGGAEPLARVVFGPDGHLYGTTFKGQNFQPGIVFNLTPPLSICKAAKCYWTEESRHVFPSFDGDGETLRDGDLIWDQQGNMYGTTAGGGTNGMGTVFQMPSPYWAEAPIYNFSGPDGNDPEDGVVTDNNRNFFGTTYFGGAHNDGTVFKLWYVPGVGWQELVLYSFTNGTDGAHPIAGVILDSSGNLYGATYQGGSANGGTVFELTPSGDTYTFKLLYSLPAANLNSGPSQSLSMDASGNLYGTTYRGGAFQMGSIFKLANTGDTWTYTSLHDFTGGADGALPQTQVTIDTDGTLYGTAYQGGSNNYGVVWMVKP